MATVYRAAWVRASDPSLNSGMHWIDPDGQGVGDDPIYVYCDMATGKYIYSTKMLPTYNCNYELV